MNSTIESKKFFPVEFHNNRHKSILARRPEIKKLMRPDSSQIFTIAACFIANIYCTYLSSRLSLPLVVLLSATIGAYLKMLCFSNGHEICHGLVHPKIKGFYKTSLLMLIQHPAFISYFGYYSWFHLSHHSQLGSQSTDQARALAQNFGTADGDALVLLHENAYLKSDDGMELTAHPLQKSLLGRVVYYGFFLQIVNLFYFALRYAIYLPVGVYRLITKWDAEKNLRRDLIAVTLDRVLFVSSLSLIAIFWGWKSLLFLALSQLFLRGFLFHPYLAYFIMGHKSYEFSDGSYQPTSSNYSPFMFLICGGGNCHVEHHDFPSIPVTKLKYLRQIAPESYTQIPHFKGVRDIYKSIFKTTHKDWVYASQNRSLKKPQKEEYAT